MIIALAGRRIDAPDATNASFPPENINRVREAIRDVLEGHNARALVSSAACGADLLAIQTAGGLALRRRIILPFDARRFRETSVIDRPGDWGSIYDLAIEDAQARGDVVIVESQGKGDEIFVALNVSILEEADALARESKDRVLAVLVWDGIRREGIDVTSAFADEARRRSLPIFEVKTL